MAFATRIEIEELTELTRSKLKLFLSVDVVGSTAFKQSQPRSHHRNRCEDTGPANWLTFLSSFYRDFGSRLKLHLGRCLLSTGLTDGDTDKHVGYPSLWKALGDELVFVIELKHEKHLSVILDAFRHAINEEIDRARAGDHPLPISFKGAAWIAGFPVCNAEIPIKSDIPQPDGKTPVIGYDYAGPCIDIGFRISKLASPHRLVVTAEIAYLLAITGSEMVHFLHPDRPTEFKGVLGGDEYPVFWIDCFRDVKREMWKSTIKGECETERLELTYRGQEALSPQCSKDALKTFLETWFERHQHLLIKPFVPRENPVIPEPPDYQQHLALVQAELRDLYRSDEESTDAGNPQGNRLVELGAEKIV